MGRVLGHIGNNQSGTAFDCAAECQRQAGQKLQKAGFPASVLSSQGDPVPLADLKGDRPAGRLTVIDRRGPEAECQEICMIE